MSTAPPVRLPLLITLCACMLLNVGMPARARAVPLQAATCTVSKAGAANYNAIQAAVNDASCATINVAPGVYDENIVINRDVALHGAGGAIIDGGARNSVVTVTSGTVSMAGLTIRNGYVKGNGGGIHNEGTLTLTSSSVISNTAVKYIGIIEYDPKGGGIYNSGTLNIEASTVTENVSSGIHNDGTLTIRASVMSRNMGGALVSNDHATISDTTISDNTGIGAYFVTSAQAPTTASLTNVTISGNTATGLLNSAALSLVNSTITNTHNQNSQQSNFRNNGSVMILNTIVAGDPYATTCDGNGTFTSKGHNIESRDTCHFSSSSDKPNTDPKIGPLQNNGGALPTHALRPDSPAIDAGSTSGCPATDARGVPRPRDGGSGTARCDIGAYEFRRGPTLARISPISIPADVPDFTLTVDGSGFANGAVVQLDGRNLPTTFASSTRLLAAISRADIVQPGTATISVDNSNGSGTSNASTLTIVAPPANHRLIEHLGGLSGGVPTVALSGTLAFIGEGSDFVVLDVHDPAQPTRLGSYATPWRVQDIEVVGTRAYATVDQTGLFIFDIGNPAAPRLLGQYPIDGKVLDVAVNGTRAYVARGSAGIVALDVSDAAKPALLGSNARPAYDLAVVGTTVYAASGDPYVSITDFTNPANPQQTVVYPVSVSSVTGVAVAGHYAYFVDGEELNILDLNDPNRSNQRPTAFYPPFKSKDITIADNRAYIASFDGAMMIFDVNDPAHPQLLSSYRTPGSSWEVRVQGQRAFIADGTNGMQIINVSDPANPQPLGRYATRSAYDVQIVGERAYVAGGRSGLLIGDVSDPAHPRQLGGLDLGGYVNHVAVVGNAAYVSNTGIHPNPDITVDSGLQIVDISDPTHPTLHETYPISIPVKVDVVGTYAFVASDQLYVLDVSDPLNPKPVSTFSADSLRGFEDVQVVGQRAYVLSSNFGILDISDPRHIAVLHTYRVDTSIHRIQIVGTTAYLLNRGYGITMLDVSDPTHPVQRNASGYIGDFLRSASVEDRLVYTTYRNTVDGYNSFNVYDVDHVTFGSSLAQDPFYDNALAIHTIGDIAYVASDETGLAIFRVRRDIFPEDAAITPDGGALMSHDRSVTATFPPQATTTPITATYAGLFEPLHPLGAGQHAARSFLLNARNAAGQPVPATQQPYTLVISYTDAQLASANVSENDLKLVRWNGAAWQDVLPCGGCSIDTASNRVTVVTSDLAEFALVGSAVPSLPPGAITPDGGSFVSDDGSARLVFPAGAVSGNVVIEYVVLATPSHALANGRVALRAFTLAARDANGQPVTHFAQPYTLSLYYNNSQIAAQNLDENSLALVFWDGSAWQDVLPCAGCGVDTTQNQLTAVLDHFTEFALVGTAGAPEQPSNPTDPGESKTRKLFLPLTQR